MLRQERRALSAENQRTMMEVGRMPGQSPTMLMIQAKLNEVNARLQFLMGPDLSLLAEVESERRLGPLLGRASSQVARARLLDPTVVSVT